MNLSERAMLEQAVDEFAAAMKKRLLSKHKQGWTGWNSYHPDSLGQRLIKNASQAYVNHDEKSLIDCGNLAMMIWRQK